MKITFLLLCVFYLSACSTNNKAILNKDSENYGKAFIFYNFVDLYLEEINGEKYKQKGFFSYQQEGDYVEPGYTTVKIRRRHSDDVKKLCFISKAGETVHISLYPEDSNQHTYPYSVFTAKHAPFGSVTDRRGMACRKESDL